MKQNIPGTWNQLDEEEKMEFAERDQNIVFGLLLSYGMLHAFLLRSHYFLLHSLGVAYVFERSVQHDQFRTHVGRNNGVCEQDVELELT